MDLDVLAGNVSTLKKNGYKILRDASFVRNLRTYGIEDIDITETTQRFRCGLITPAGHRLPTKVEFSRRRSSTDEPVTALIDPEIARQFHKRAFRCQHYSGEVAVQQKIRALAGRSETQARDVFDLGILHEGGYTASVKSNKTLTRKLRQQAIKALLSLTQDDFNGQVVELLDTEDRAMYDAATAWEQLQETVLGLLDDA